MKLQEDPNTNITVQISDLGEKNMLSSSDNCLIFKQQLLVCS